MTSYLSPRFLTVDEAARLLRISRSTLERRTAEGRIGCVKDGRRVLYRREEIEGYLDTRYVAPVTFGLRRNRR